ncbi:VOC family protein [Streptomyces bathyalis]|uniref:VOC family protein n=1 Tax=Streptomyces bathyalis TaxID=2710756 RepID=A0A7T1WT78_9ACTN|nr:VOC family protein [Streptomyces bathyalis]QPP09938.1 VOC family protein [Streptomyces bathyalis]
MTSNLRNISVDCANPYALARFWSEVLGIPVHPDDEPGDDEVGIPLDGGGTLLFLKVPESKAGKNRLHLCVEAQVSRDREVERLLQRGATMFDDRRAEDGTGWAVLADPEGNEFCVLRSAAEREATSAASSTGP